MLIGPNTGLGHTSVVVMAEYQTAYVLDALRVMDERHLLSVEIRPEMQAVYNDEVQRRLAGTVWTAGGCRSWYLDDSSRNIVQWPGGTRRFRRMMERFDADRYRMTAASVPS